MVNTGNNKITVKSGVITVIDDINTSNKDDIFRIINNSTLYIDKKFPLPINASTDVNINNLALKNKIDSLFSRFNNGDHSVFSSETQIKGFEVKISFWITNVFSKVISKLEHSEETVLVINHDLSKHEIIFVQWLAELGVAVLVISKNTNFTCEVNKIEFNTSEGIKYNENNEINCNCVKTPEPEYNSIEEIESALYNSNNKVQLIVAGCEDYNNTKNFYGKLHKVSEENKEFVLVTDKFDIMDFLQKVRGLGGKKSYNALMASIPMVLEVDNKNEASDKIRNYFSLDKYKEMNSSILFNKIVYAVGVINKLYNSKAKTLIYYGNAKENDIIAIECLKEVLNINILVLSPNKDDNKGFKTIARLELANTSEMFDMPTVDTRDNITTLAANAQDRVNSVLYNGDTLGMYKPGMFKGCISKHLSTTYDELKIWWNKESYVRPNFTQENFIATVPTIFAAVYGVPEDMSTSDYIREVSKYACGKTVVVNKKQDMRKLSLGIDSLNMNIEDAVRVHNLTDINGTSYSEQKPFIVKGKLDRNRIRNSKNYKYRIIQPDKQEDIFNKIDEILTGGYFTDSIKNNYDKILNILLNLTTEAIQLIQWFEYYTYSPNIVVIARWSEQLRFEDMVLLKFFELLGFDILLFIPTKYSLFEHLLTDKFVYDKHIIGNAVYDIPETPITVTSNIEIREHNTVEEGKGMIKKFFGLFK